MFRVLGVTPAAYYVVVDDADKGVVLILDPRQALSPLSRAVSVWYKYETYSLDNLWFL